MSAVRKLKPLNFDIPQVSFFPQLNIGYDEVFEDVNPFETLLIKNDTWVQTTKDQWVSEEIEEEARVELLPIVQLGGNLSL
jgi:hypothetical protein